MNTELTKKLFGRDDSFFHSDFVEHKHELENLVRNSSFLILGAAGTIGGSITKEIFNLNPKVLHAVDISENNLVELVRSLRSNQGYIDGEFKTFCLDIGSDIFDAFMINNRTYDYVLNLSALKHVRSERDSYTLMRMIETNIFNTIKTIELSSQKKSKKYFCVSTDKAANPANLMGATKRIMEMFLFNNSNEIIISSARFANVAFSDGSLLHGFKKRFDSKEPIAAPKDIKRYFVTEKESGVLCLFSSLLGENLDIFYPILQEKKDSFTFSDLAKQFIQHNGYEPYECSSEDEARQSAKELIKRNLWPCFFFESDTTGEKYIEEFYTDGEEINEATFKNIGIVKNKHSQISSKLENFYQNILSYRSRAKWTKENLVEEIFNIIPDLSYEDKQKYLDDRM